MIFHIERMDLKGKKRRKFQGKKSSWTIGKGKIKEEQ